MSGLKICSRCKTPKPYSAYIKNKTHSDGLRSECKECSKSEFTLKNKGVREYQLIINYFLIIDRIRGASYGELAKRYKLDSSNISKRIRGVLNAT